MTSDQQAAEHSFSLPRLAKPIVLAVLKLMSEGRVAEAASELLKIDRFEADNPLAFKLTKGHLQIDLGTELRDPKLVSAGLGLTVSVAPEDLPPDAACSYWYNLGNGHLALCNLRKLPPGIGRVQDENFREAKRAYRTAMARPTKGNGTAPRLYTNYGNLLTKVGRYVEAIGAYDKALEHEPEHAMATLNKGTALCEYLIRLARPQSDLS